jgi:SHS2 domain-containing protein
MLQCSYVCHLLSFAAAACCTAPTRRGERFDRSRHECGTEVKAVTYSAMQIRQQPGDAEVFVIVDI